MEFRWTRIILVSLYILMILFNISLSIMVLYELIIQISGHQNITSASYTDQDDIIVNQIKFKVPSLTTIFAK
ncbi:ORF85 [white sturgeon herpesvirus 2]|uniref:ORF86 n=1 Tax=white sturgeon herpesvirus 2 TaxID=320884 RepID=F6GQ89_9VIRU|nr:ORF85 [Acipenserid herpesvirus 2]AEF97709.1 ORF85 [Acipenserid herpesvirus 2]